MLFLGNDSCLGYRIHRAYITVSAAGTQGENESILVSGDVLSDDLFICMCFYALFNDLIFGKH